jgi:hypothetical protein
MAEIKVTTQVLTEQEIDDRITVLDAADVQACQGCGAAAVAVADDPTWHIEGVLMAHSGGYSIHAVIPCSACW